MYGGSPEEGAANLATFSDKSVRLGFIRKVYGILVIQLIITAGFVGVFTMESVKLYAAHNPWMFYTSLVLMLVCLFSMACCEAPRRKTPWNFIFLGIFTICEGFLLGCATSMYRANEVLIAVGVVTVLVLALTLFAFQTKIDFTAFNAVMMIVLLVFVLFGFVYAFFPQSKTINLVYACFGALIFSIYLVMDTQMMVGGTHKYTISPEEYIFGALNLYLDIINLFLYILSIVGNSR